jgi:hypothetical protein
MAKAAKVSIGTSLFGNLTFWEPHSSGTSLFENLSVTVGISRKEAKRAKQDDNDLTPNPSPTERGMRAV